MENTSNSIIYAVNSDLDDGLLYAEFGDKDAAIDYAKQHLDKLPFVDELEVSYDANGEIDNVFSYKTIWDHTMPDQEAEAATADATVVDSTSAEDAYWDFRGAQEIEAEKNKYDIGDTTWFESMDNLVEEMEKNEDMVECKECFDLFPKTDCIKVDLGYVCPTCHNNGKVFTVSDNEIFNVDFPEYEKFSDDNDPEFVNEPEMDQIQPEVVEVEKEPISKPEEAVPFLVNDEVEAVAGYEKAAEVVADSDLENKEEILDVIEHIKEEEEEHIEELQDLMDDEIVEVENDPISDEAKEVEETAVDIEEPAILTEDSELKTWICWYEGKDIGTVEAATEEEAAVRMMIVYPDYQYNNTDWSVELADEEYLTEHINKECPPIESDQKLEGTDNAVVDCKVADVVTHSEAEKPVDCEGKKKPLEKPLTEGTKELGDDFEIKEELNLQHGSAQIKSIARLVQTAVDKITKDNRVGTRPDGASFYVLSDKRSANPEQIKKAIVDTLAQNGYDPEVVQYVDKGQVYGFVVDRIRAAARTAVKYENLTESVKFTKEEQEEFNMDEDGNSLDSYDHYVRCTWCDEIFTEDQCVFEADMGWLCDRCYEAILSRGEKLTIIKNPTEEDEARILTEDTEDENEPISTNPEEKLPKNLKMANTASLSGMDFEAACEKFGVNLEN